MLLSDTGTRFQHYSELLDLWKSGLEILQEQKENYVEQHKDYFSNVQEMEIKDLESAIKLLEKQLEILSDFHNTQWKIRQLVDGIEPTGADAVY